MLVVGAFFQLDEQHHLDAVQEERHYHVQHAFSQLSACGMTEQNNKNVVKQMHFFHHYFMLFTQNKKTHYWLPTHLPECVCSLECNRGSDLVAGVLYLERKERQWRSLITTE